MKPFRIESTPSPDGNGLDGKSAIWRASFASAIQHGVKPFFWSGSNAPDAPSRGVSPGNEDVYNPSNASTQIFDVAFLKVDSDQAFAEAQKHGGDKILEKDPTTPVHLHLRLEPQHQRTDLARHLWRFSRNRQADGCGQRLDRRVYPRGEIEIGFAVAGMVAEEKQTALGPYSRLRLLHLVLDGGEEAAQGAGGSDRAFSVWCSQRKQYLRRNTEDGGGRWRTARSAVRPSRARRSEDQPGNPCLPAGFIVQHLQLLSSN